MAGQRLNRSDIWGILHLLSCRRSTDGVSMLARLSQPHVALAGATARGRASMHLHRHHGLADISLNLELCPPHTSSSTFKTSCSNPQPPRHSTPHDMSSIPPKHQHSADQPPSILPFTAVQPETIRLYPLSNYTFGTKEQQPEEDDSVKKRLERLEQYYSEHGMRRACEGVLICHEHNHPHVLMLQIANTFFKLPGDYIAHDADEVTGFKARLNERLAPANYSTTSGENDWNVHSTLAQWWRPNFETFMYPYLPPHVSRPKECKKLYFVQLPSSKVIFCPKNMKLIAVPLFELFDNSGRYGPQLSAIPHYLSRYRWEFVDEEGEVVAWTPGGEVDERVKTKILAGGEEVKKEVDGTNGMNGYGSQEVEMAVG